MFRWWSRSCLCLLCTSKQATQFRLLFRMLDYESHVLSTGRSGSNGGMEILPFELMEFARLRMPNVGDVLVAVIDNAHRLPATVLRLKLAGIARTFVHSRMQFLPEFFLHGAGDRRYIKQALLPFGRSEFPRVLLDSFGEFTH